MFKNEPNVVMGSDDENKAKLIITIIIYYITKRNIRIN